MSTQTQTGLFHVTRHADREEGLAQSLTGAMVLTFVGAVLFPLVAML